jgi:protein-tyrosine phosphatase
LVLAERDLELTTDPNLRDIGGYRTASGDWVRMGVVYRSQALHSLSAADLATVDQLGITNVYDLRTPDESSGSPDAAVQGATYQLLNVFGTPGPIINAGTTSASAQQSMVDMNVHFVTGSPDRAALKKLITDIADSTGAQLFNCTAGKDRTGWATAVIQSVLGVPESTVMQDYLLSNRYYFDSPAVQSSIKSASPSQAATSTAILDVNAKYLEAGLDQMKKSYGSTYNYVVQGLGVSPATVAKLRQRLLVS